MRFNTVFTILFITCISGKVLAQAQVKDTAHSWKEMCSPIQANVHEPLRCRERDNAEGTELNFDEDCCAGADNTPIPGFCGNGFNRTQKGVCGEDNEWCHEHECRHYTCEKSTPCLVYVGCFNDKRDAPEFLFKTKKLNPQSVHDEKSRILNSTGLCVNYCRKEKFSYAAIQGAGTCFCGDSYGKYGKTDDRFCGKKEGKAIALRCGDGEEGTCVGVNAVYRVTGDQYCCNYFQAPQVGGTVAWFLLLIGPIIAVAASICCICIPACIGLCIWQCSRKKHKERQAQRNQSYMAEAERAADSSVAVVQPANVSAVSVTVVDPATQKTNAMAPAPVVASSMVVAQPAVVVASAQPPSIYPTMET